MRNDGTGQQILAEIWHQPQAWAETIETVEARAIGLQLLFTGVDEVVFTGCGSGLNAALCMAPAWQYLTGVRARAVPAAEMVFFPETVFVPQDEYLVVAVSRSGATSETVLACERARTTGKKTLAVTCDPASPLAQIAAQTLALEAARELSVTTTQSLSSMILCGQVLSGIVARRDEYVEQLRRLPEFGKRLLEPSEVVGKAIAQNDSITKFAFVGSGPYLGLAREGQLKIKEMVLLPSDAYPMLDYRHGPKSNVDEHMLVTALLSDRTRAVEIEFLREMKGLRGHVLVVCDRADDELRATADHVAEMGSGLPDFVRDILYLLPIQFLAFYKSLRRGLDPERPQNLTYWVETTRL
jgi:glucosamine--fructose-6-phosphate aminotransferase (isomerizing)